MKRKSISKKVRFEVFKRDSFKCQYCGKPAPDVLLEVDHIEPVSKGGSNDIINLITSCYACNRGKSNRKISDDSIITKRKSQLDELNKRREQLKMMMEWNDELSAIDDEQQQYIQKIFESGAGKKYWNYSMSSRVFKLLKKYNFNEIVKAVNIAMQQYFKSDADGEITNESIEYAFNKIPGICKVNASGGFDEDLKKMYYIRGILRNRVYCNDTVCMILMKDAVKLNANLDSIMEVAKNCKNWTEWKTSLTQFISVNAKSCSEQC